MLISTNPVRLDRFDILVVANLLLCNISINMFIYMLTGAIPKAEMQILKLSGKENYFSFTNYLFLMYHLPTAIKVITRLELQYC